MQTTKITGTAAIDYAAAHPGTVIHKHTDPTEGARSGLTVEEAREVADEDPSLIYVEVAGLKTYRIESSAGVVMGDFAGVTEADALDTMARDAGYKSQADAEARGIAAFDGTVTEIEACAYCSESVALRTGHEVPALKDDAEWAIRAKEHGEDCEWVATRAHRLDHAEAR